MRDVGDWVKLAEGMDAPVRPHIGTSANGGMSVRGRYPRRVASWVDGFEFSEVFWDLRDGEGATHARALHTELEAELSIGHPLHGLDCRVVAKALPQDEVVVVAGELVALVHLTWSGRREQPPFPTVEFADSAAAFRELVQLRY